MKKIEHDIHMVITELDAQAEVVIPPLEMNDLMRERDEYLAQTAADLYDRVVYMVRSNNMEYDPKLDEEEDGPFVEIMLKMNFMTVATRFWLETRRQRQDRLRTAVNELFQMLMNMKKNFDDVMQESK